MNSDIFVRMIFVLLSLFTVMIEYIFVSSFRRVVLIAYSACNYFCRAWFYFPQTVSGKSVLSCDTPFLPNGSLVANIRKLIDSLLPIEISICY